MDSSDCALDLGEVRRFGGVIFDPAHNAELRFLPSRTSAVVRGADLDAAAAAVSAHAHEHCYCVLNPVGVPVGTKAAGAADVIRRLWLFIEVDPVRPPGQAATDAEKEQARRVARAVYLWLQERGWPEPVAEDSGNGCYLLYRVDLPPEKEVQDLIRDLLCSLAVKFNTPGARVDTAVHDLPRLARVAGTVNRKGDGGGDRPHRVARLLRVPDELRAVSREQIESAVEAMPPPEIPDEVQPPARALPQGSGPRPGDDYNRAGDVRQVLLAHGWQLEGERNGRQCWTRPGKEPRDGLSATFGYCRSRNGGYPLFYVFSSNAPPFDAGRAYSPFSVYAWLECEGDFAAAARGLGAQGYGGQRHGRNGAPPSADRPPPSPDAPSWRVGGLTLTLVGCRQTPQKITADVDVRRGPEVLATIKLTNASASQREVARKVVAVAARGGETLDPAEVSASLDLLLVRARADASEASRRTREGKSIKDVLQAVPERLGITHKGELGTMWSERERREFSREQFTKYQPEDLVALCLRATDAPADAIGNPDRRKVLFAMAAELGVLWSNMTDSLPLFVEADLSSTPSGAATVRNVILDVWAKPNTCVQERIPEGVRVVVYHKCSLAALARNYLDEVRRGVTLSRGWLRLDESLDAWCRSYTPLGGGKPRLALAMTYRLLGQLSAPTLNCEDQSDFQRLTVKVKATFTDSEVKNLANPDSTFTRRQTGGRMLSVLSEELTDDILFNPHLNEDEVSASPDGTCGGVAAPSEGSEES